MQNISRADVEDFLFAEAELLDGMLPIVSGMDGDALHRPG